MVPSFRKCDWVLTVWALSTFLSAVDTMGNQSCDRPAHLELMCQWQMVREGLLLHFFYLPETDE